MRLALLCHTNRPLVWPLCHSNGPLIWRDRIPRASLAQGHLAAALQPRAIEIIGSRLRLHASPQVDLNRSRDALLDLSPEVRRRHRAHHSS